MGDKRCNDRDGHFFSDVQHGASCDCGLLRLREEDGANGGDEFMQRFDILSATGIVDGRRFVPGKMEVLNGYATMHATADPTQPGSGQTGKTLETNGWEASAVNRIAELEEALPYIRAGKPLPPEFLQRERERFRERAEYYARYVAPAIDALTRRVRAGTDTEDDRRVLEHCGVSRESIRSDT